MNKWVISIVLVGLMASVGLGLNGDLGVGTDPLTDGSAEHPWLIEDFADFQAFCNDASKWAAGQDTRLEADIDLDPALPGRAVYTRAPIAGDKNDTNTWDGTAIFDGTEYSGVFDGNDQTISNLTVHGANYGGLFGRIDSDGTVTDLGLENAAIVATGDYVGGLVGENRGGGLSNCYSSGTVTGTSYYVGGLVGYNYSGSISNCYATGLVSGSSYDVGGLVGRNSGSLSQCYSSGTITGTGYIGGLIGYYYSGTITGCFWDIETSGMASGLGYGSSIGITGKTTAQMQDINTFINAGWDFVDETAHGTSETWQMPALGGYPVLSRFNGYTPVLLSGEGSPSDPYLISNALELGAVCHYDSSACYKLTADIDLSGIEWSTAVIPLFNGHFDGDGHVINHLTISGGGCLGLFGKIDGGAVIIKLVLENLSITGTGIYVGGLVGDNYYGSVSQCYSSGAVNGTSYVGGLVGDNYYGSVSQCYSSGTVTGTSFYAGGLVGYNDEGSVSQCYSSGNVNGDQRVGGLVGLNDEGSVSQCYSSGTVTSIDFPGGLVGRNKGSLSQCFWDVETSGIADPQAGSEDTDGMIGKTTAQMQDINTFINAGWDFVDETAHGTSETWQMPALGGYPVLSHFNGYTPVLLSGEGSPSDPYLISNALELGAVCHYDSSACYKLTADIDLSGIEWSTAVIPLFNGHFDGDGHVINHLTISGGGYLGLFGKIDGGAVIIKLGLENLSITGTGSYIGGLVGYNWYDSLSQCYSSGTVTGTKYVGGLVGYSWYGSLSQCYSSGTVTGTSYYVGGLVGNNFYASLSQCYSSGAVNGTSYVGGLVGNNFHASLSQCYSSGAVNGTSSVGGLVGLNDEGSVSQCYSSGAVNGTSHVGGLMGDNYNGIVSNCFWDVQSSGIGAAGTNGAIGKTTAEMQTQSTFTAVGWDFDPDDGDPAGWQMVANDYPRLTWERITIEYVIVPDMIGMDEATAIATIQTVNLTVGTVTRAYSNTVAAGLIISQTPAAGESVAEGSAVDFVVSLGKFYSGGDGTQAQPYEISSIADWTELRNNSPHWNKYFILTANIDFGGAEITPIAPDAEPFSWEFQGTKFTGQLDGNSYTLKNFIINQPTSYSVGLFGCLGAGSQIQNLGVVNATIIGREDVGGLVGMNYGSLSQCYSSGTVNGNESLGGLCGFNWEGTITSCYATSAVTGNAKVGGLCGYNYYGTITDCYATGAVTGNASVGGLCGGNNGKINDCYWDIQTSGQPTSVGGWGLSTVEMKQSVSYYGWTSGTWTIDEGAGYPRLAWENAVGTVINTDYPPRSYSGSGTQEDPFKLGTTEDLLRLSRRTIDWNSHLELTEDIDLSGITFHHALIASGSQFGGVMDGHGFCIINLTIEARSYIGLFAAIGRSGQVKNLGVKNATITGLSYVGGLCGKNAGTITNCYVAGVVTGREGYVSVGGLCGFNEGTINNCYATGAVTGNADVGGLVGYNYSGSISNCYATGLVSGSSYDVGGLVGRNSGSLSQCYSSGTITGTGYIGGLIGYYYSGTITGCFWDIETSGMASGLGYGSSIGITGKTTAQMQDINTFINAGWDFVGETANGTTDIWRMIPNSYPIHSFTGAFVLDVSELIVTEGQTLTFGIVLPYSPAGEVELELSITGDSDFELVTARKLVFNAENWNKPQTVSVRANYDANYLNDQTLLMVRSSNYAISFPLSEIDIQPAPPAAVIITETDTLTVQENSTGQLSVRLAEDPLGLVTINASWQQAAANLSITAGQSLKFDSSNYQIPQFINLTAAPDANRNNSSAILLLSSPNLQASLYRQIVVEEHDTGSNLTGTLPTGDTVVSETQPVLLNNIIIPQGGRLIVGGGTVLKLTGGSNKIQVDGELVIEGTSGSPVIITSDKDDAVGGDSNGDGTGSTPKPGDWQGIVVNATGIASLNNVEIKYATTGIYLAGTWNAGDPAANVKLSNVIVAGCSQYGIYTWIHYADILAENCLIVNNGGDGVFYHGESRGVFRNCTIAGNGNGIRHENITDLTLENCIVAYNDNGLVHTGSTPFLDIRNSCFWNPSGQNISGVTVDLTANGNVVADPRFVNYAGGDYTLADGSPAIDSALGASAVAVDMVGRERYDDKGMPNVGRGANWITDMGAFERQSDTLASDLAVVSVDYAGETRDVMPGDVILVDFTVMNLGKIECVGGWSDKVYFSSKPVMGSDAVLVGTVSYDGYLVPGGNYTQSVEVTVPAGSGPRYLIVANDASKVAWDVVPGNNLLASSRTLDVNIPEITVGTAVTGIANASQWQYLRYKPEVLRTVRFDLAGQKADWQFGQRYDLPPVANDGVSTMATDGQLRIFEPQDGYYYIGVRAGSQGSNFTLAAEYTGLAITGAVPNVIGDRGESTLKISGDGFDRDSIVTLGSVAGKVMYQDASTLYVTFDFGSINISTGNYDLTATTVAGSFVAKNAVTVEPTRIARLETDITFPAIIRPGRTVTVDITYKNTSNVDLGSPLLTISSDEEAGIWYLPVADREFEGSRIKLLGLSTSGPLTTLRPGQQETLSLKYTSSFGDASKVKVTLSAMGSVTDDGSDLPVEWPNYVSAFDLENRSLIVSELSKLSGNSMGEYISSLRDIAQVLPDEVGSAYVVDDLFDTIMMMASSNVFPSVTGEIVDAVSGYVHSVDGGYIYLQNNVSLIKRGIILKDGTFFIVDVPAGGYEVHSHCVSINEESSHINLEEDGLDGYPLFVNPTGNVFGKIFPFISMENVNIIAVDSDKKLTYAELFDDGTYQINLLMPGKYNIYVDSDSSQSQLFNDVEVKPGQTVVQNIEMKLGATLAGLFFAPDTMSGTDLNIKIFNEAGYYREEIVKADKPFSISGLPNGVYDILVWADQIAYEYYQGIDLMSQNTWDMETCVLEPGSVLICSFYDFNMQPWLTSVMYSIYENNGTRPIVTNEALGGASTINYLKPGQYTIRSSADSVSGKIVIVDVTDGEDNPVSIVFENEYNITGILTDENGLRLFGVAVNLTSLQSVDIVTYTDENGLYSFNSVEAGEYRVRIDIVGGGACYRDILVGNNVSDTDLVMLNSGYVYGLVLDNDGIGISGANVLFLEHDEIVSSVVTNTSGQYCFAILNPGRYSVRALVDDTRIAEEYFDITEGNPVAEISLASNVTHLEGGVYDAAHSPVENCHVVLRNERNDIIASTKTGVDGLFKMASMPAGNYILTAIKKYYAIQNYDISINVGNNSLDAIYMKRGHIIQGSIVDDYNGCIAGAMIDIYDQGNRLLYRDVCDDNGKYELSVIPDGNIYIEAYAKDYNANRVMYRIEHDMIIPAISLESTKYYISGRIIKSDAYSGLTLVKASNLDLDKQYMYSFSGSEFNIGGLPSGRYVFVFICPDGIVRRMEMANDCSNLNIGDVDGESKAVPMHGILEFSDDERHNTEYMLSDSGQKDNCKLPLRDEIISPSEDCLGLVQIINDKIKKHNELVQHYNSIDYCGQIERQIEWYQNKKRYLMVKYFKGASFDIVVDGAGSIIKKLGGTLGGLPGYLVAELMADTLKDLIDILKIHDALDLAKIDDTIISKESDPFYKFTKKASDLVNAVTEYGDYDDAFIDGISEKYTKELSKAMTAYKELKQMFNLLMQYYTELSKYEQELFDYIRKTKNNKQKALEKYNKSESEMARYEEQILDLCDSDDESDECPPGQKAGSECKQIGPDNYQCRPVCVPDNKCPSGTHSVDSCTGNPQDGSYVCRKQCVPDCPNPPCDDDDGDLVRPRDPEDKFGPGGYDVPGTTEANLKHYIKANESIPYRIEFWNHEDAEVPAQVVTMRDTLDPTVWDLSTLEFTRVGFLKWDINLPNGTRAIEQRIDLRPDMDLVVDVTTTVDYETGLVMWRYQCSDPLTGDYPTDPTAGFLPPFNKETGYELGWMEFRVKPLAGMTTGTVIANRAYGEFDDMGDWANNPAPKLGPWINTIDAGLPVSAVKDLPADSSRQFTVSWSGTDDTGGSGIGSYDIYVSTNGGPFMMWLSTASTSAVFTGEPGNSYAFYSVARDNVGNMEVKTSGIEAITQVLDQLLAIEGWQLNKKTRVGRTIFDYHVAIKMHNFGSEPIENITLDLIDLPEGLTLLDSSVALNSMAADSQAVTSDTLTIRIDRSVPMPELDITCRVGFDVAGKSRQWLDYTGLLTLTETDLNYQPQAVYALADQTRNGVVDMDDLEALCEVWLQDNTNGLDIAPPPYGDGVVNMLDFQYLAENWLQSSAN